MPKTKRPTLNDIAEQAGCAPQAVSRILNPGSSSTSNVSDTLKAKVLKIAEEIGYTPRQRQQRTTQKARILILIESSLENAPWAESSMRILRNPESTWDYTPHIRIMDQDSAAIAEQAAEELDEYIRINKINGILSIHHSNPLLDQLATQHNISVVYVNPNTVQSHNCLLHDDAIAVRQTMQLARLEGMTQAAYLGMRARTESHRHHSIPLRFNTMKEYCESLNIPLYIAEDDNQSQLKQVMALPEKLRTSPLTVFATNDFKQDCLEWIAEHTNWSTRPLVQSSTSQAGVSLQHGLLYEHALQRLLLLSHRGYKSFENVLFPPTINI